MWKKTNLDAKLTPFIKVNSKWVLHLNETHKAIELLEDNTGENLDDLGYDFLGSTPKAHFMKEIIDTVDFINIKNFSSSQGNVKRMLWQNKDLEKIFAKDSPG